MYAPTVGSSQGEFREPSAGFAILATVIHLGEAQSLWHNGALILAQGVPNLTSFTETKIAAASSRGQEEGPITLGHQSKKAFDMGRHFEG